MATADDIMSAEQAIEHDPPNVWLTSYYGFTPESWGMLGFTREEDRRAFLRGSRPGALVVIYGVGSEIPEDQRGRILGVQQVSHEVGYAENFVSKSEWRAKQSDSDTRDRWNFGVRAVRAWLLAPEDRVPVEEFANLSYSSSSGRHIGRRGIKLMQSEAAKLMGFDWAETSVFRGPRVDALIPESARTAFKPSKAGPVSQTSHLTKEAEGPKYLYILRLVGNETHFLGRDAGGKSIIKVGFSCSPATRCEDHNQHLPRDAAFRWEVLLSTRAEEEEPYPSSFHAEAGERMMKDILDEDAQSLGGEFFLAEETDYEQAWYRGKRAAMKWTP